jgi:putative transposase
VQIFGIARNAGGRARRMGQSYTNLIYHIVFATKDRQQLITGDRKVRLYEYLGGVIRNLGGVSLGINGMADHTHVLTKLRPDKALSDMLRDLKANSSGWMNDVFPERGNFAWQRGYGAFTVSASQVEKVQHYIAEQEIHHAKRDFRDEFVELLAKNGVEFDEKYLEIGTLPPAVAGFR